MNNNGQPSGVVAGLTALIGSSGIVCSPSVITRTGTVSLSPTVTSTIAETAEKVQNVESTENSTKINGSLQVVDYSNVDPFIVIDPTASLVVQGPAVSVSNLQALSNEADIGTETSPFYRVYANNVNCDNVVTASSNLNALTTTVSNHTSIIMDLSNTTQNQSASLGVTNFAGQVMTAQFVKVGGTSNQFLMADGSVSEGQMQNVSMDQDVVPLTMANASVAANSYDYYIEDEMTRDITVRALRISCSTVGADSIRVAIYRFGTIIQGKFILCGQSAATPATAVATIPIVAQIGQNLNFSKGESFVIGIAVGGTTTSLRGVTYTANTSRYFFNTTDSVSSGFPTNPRVITGGVSVMPCIRLIAV